MIKKYGPALLLTASTAIAAAAGPPQRRLGGDQTAIRRQFTAQELGRCDAFGLRYCDRCIHCTPQPHLKKTAPPGWVTATYPKKAAGRYTWQVNAQHEHSLVCGTVIRTQLQGSVLSEVSCRSRTGTIRHWRLDYTSRRTARVPIGALDVGSGDEVLGFSDKQLHCDWDSPWFWVVVVGSEGFFDECRSGQSLDLLLKPHEP